MQRKSSGFVVYFTCSRMSPLSELSQSFSPDRSVDRNSVEPCV